MSGKWNSYVELTASKPDGTPADGAAPRRLWSCAAKPEDDPYGCTHFAWKLANCDLLRNPPLPSDSRRRPDRQALQDRHMVVAAAEKGLIEDEQRNERKVRQQSIGSRMCCQSSCGPVLTARSCSRLPEHAMQAMFHQPEVAKLLVCVLNPTVFHCGCACVRYLDV
jgi:hypothetical protein